MTTTEMKGKLLPIELSQQIKEKFFYVDTDYAGQKRLFFENAGGSFTLKAAMDAYSRIEAIGDCPERLHATADYLNKVIDQGTQDIKTILNAEHGSLITMLTASQVIFEMTRVAAENLPGGNIVTTELEHPSAYDAAKLYAAKTGRELRIAKTNPITGGVDATEIARLIDDDTCFLSVIFASNISGAILDMVEIVKMARAIKPDLHILVDAVQHAPHGIIDFQELQVDGINFAPYKFFGIRGCGIGWVSERFARLTHNKLEGKPENEWELGSPAPAQFAGISEIVNYVAWLGGHFCESQNRKELFSAGMKAIHLHERALLHHLLEGSGNMPGLRAIPHVRVHLDYPDLTMRDLIVALEIDNLEYAQAVKEYEKLGVTVFERVSSSIYSKRMVESFGLKGAVRVSPLHCHLSEDIDAFLKITARLAVKFNS